MSDPFRQAMPALEREHRPVHIPTAVNAMESRALYELARKAGSVLEVGAWFGYSTVLMAMAGANVYSIDPHLEDGTREPYLKNVEESGVGHRIFTAFSSNRDALPAVDWPDHFGAAFIDGDHTFEECSFDIRQARRLVMPGGVIACHDYTPLWPGVIEAVRAEALDLMDGARVVGTLILLTIPPAG